MKNSTKLSLALAITTLTFAAASAYAAEDSAPSVLACSMSYQDTGIQKEPLYTESFEVNLQTAPNAAKKFGVSPSNGIYFVSVGQNNSSAREIILSIFNSTTGLHTFSFVPNEHPTQQILVLNVTSSQQMVLSCTKK